MRALSVRPIGTRPDPAFPLTLAAAALAGVLVLASHAIAQEPAAPQAVPAAQLQNAIGKLGDLDYATRTDASRTVRRTPGSQAVPALMQGVGEHTDGYVRYRALVVLTGFNDPRTTDVMREALNSPNDRLRAVAYSFFEHNPAPSIVPLLLTAFEKEHAEFVRPALVRALAAADMLNDWRAISRRNRSWRRVISKPYNVLRIYYWNA